MRCRPEALANMCSPNGSWEIKEYPLSWDVSRELKKIFFLVPGSPSFQGCTDCTFCQRLPGRLLFLYLFILFHVYSILISFMLSFFFSFYSIPTESFISHVFNIRILLRKYPKISERLTMSKDNGHCIWHWTVCHLMPQGLMPKLKVNQLHSKPTTFMGINPKVNVIAWLEFELTYNDGTVKHISHYIIRTFPALNVVWY